MKKITIIVPSYNEEEALPYLYERLNTMMNLRLRWIKSRKDG